jgi:xanthine dehydrogenase YagT iron-sulfur-binding subunit
LVKEMPDAISKELIRLKVNGERREVAVPAHKLLLDVLREDLALTGSKRGCDDSSCGCCGVLVDGVPMLSCVALASSYQDCEIVTIEGLAAPGKLIKNGHRSSSRFLRDQAV